LRTHLGVDGGGSKTAFLLIDDAGRVLASHTEGPAYYLQIGLDEMRAMLARGIGATLQVAGVSPADLDFAFIALPAYGEDSQLLPALDSAATPLLSPRQYRCGNDAVCGWAGALACQDGINIVAGTGSIAYGEFDGRTARAGGWGELFSDEGSAHWVAREGLSLFSRMSDGRAPRGALYDIFRQHFGLTADLDLCAAIYGQGARSDVASLAKLVADAALIGDTLAAGVFGAAADELAQIVAAVQRGLEIPAGVPVTVSYSGGLFQQRELLLEPLQRRLADAGRATHRFVEPRLPPVAGAAMYAAKLRGTPLNEQAVQTLITQL
jgi:N-acetylglucosamine kinase-like BadF-type ATPase